MKIKYETEGWFKCVTPCPFGEKFGKYVIMVGSGICNNCKHYKGIDTKSKQVFCSKED